MTLRSNAVEGVEFVPQRSFPDHRGMFMPAWTNELRRLIPDGPIEVNCSVSHERVLRGMHLQLGNRAQGKYVTCLSGEIFDAWVDCRPKSRTFGKIGWTHLSPQCGFGVWLPPGLAHGFYTLQGPAWVHYVVDQPHTPTLESGFRWNDPEIAIPWPLKIRPVLSDKDDKLGSFRDLVARLS